MNSRRHLRGKYNVKASVELEAVNKAVKSACSNMRSLIMDSASTGMSDILEEIKNSIADHASSLDSAKEASSLQKEFDKNLAKTLKKTVEEEIDYLLEVLGKELYPFLKLVTHEADVSVRYIDHAIKELESHED